MREAWFMILDNFKSFVGNGWLLWFGFCIALVFLLWKGENRRKRLVTFCVLALVILFNPLVYSTVGAKFLSGVYWRLFWILPIVPAAALVLTDAVGAVRQNIVRIAAAGILCIAIAKTGTFFFNGQTYCRPENEYQIPQVAIDISDKILEETENVSCTVIMPNELLCYIRQYTSKINLYYGRNIWGYINTPTADQLELYELMNGETIDFQKLHDAAGGYGCRFVVFNSDMRQIPENMESYGYTFVAGVGCYLIYSLE